MNYDDQYDAPLSGPERARIEALKLTTGGFYDSPEKWVEAARIVELFIIGERSAEVRAVVDQAYDLAYQLEREGLDRARLDNSAWVGGPEFVQVDTARLRDLVTKLSSLSSGPPF